MAETKKEQEPVVQTTGGGRSVNYPYITLETAIERAEKLWDAVGKGLIAISSAGKTWGYDAKSSAVRSTVSALKQYGLIQDEGSGEDREIKLTDRTLDILHPSDPLQRVAAIQTAALAPKIYADIFAKFPMGIPTQDHIIAAYLLREKDFNRKTVDSFINNFRANLDFAKVPSSGMMPDKKDSKAKGKVEVGDWVQWESGGALQFANPHQVRAIKDHEGAEWVFVEGSETGIPMMEIVLEKKGDKQSQISPPTLPIKPAAKQVGAAIPVSPTCSISILADGEVTQDGLDKLKAYIDLIKASFPKTSLEALHKEAIEKQ